MKALMNVCVVSALALPVAAFAETDTTPKTDTSQKAPAGMNCPMMGDTGAMQKDMGAMMKDMSAMMSSTTDPSMKGRMQKMHDQMGAMMGNMQKMGGGMMGGGMMQGGQNSGSAPSTTPPASSDDHNAHHPAQ